MPHDADLDVTTGGNEGWVERTRRLRPASGLTVAELREEHDALVARVARLEAELGQERRLQRRVAELVDVVQQLLIDQATVDEATRARLEAYVREV